MMGAPGSYMDKVISVWMSWGPNDDRGIATLEKLQEAINSNNLSRLVLTLE